MAEGGLPISQAALQAQLNQNRARTRRLGADNPSPSPSTPTGTTAPASQAGMFSRLMAARTSAKKQAQPTNSAQAPSLRETVKKNIKGGIGGSSPGIREQLASAKALLKSGANSPLVARRINLFVLTTLGVSTWFIVPLIVLNLEMVWGSWIAKGKSPLIPALKWDHFDGGQFAKGLLPNFTLHLGLLFIDLIVLLVLALLLALFLIIGLVLYKATTDPASLAKLAYDSGLPLGPIINLVRQSIGL